MNNSGKRIHFIGIGGAGMSGIASLMLELGYQISGSDLNSNISTERLIDKGALIYKGHDGRHVLGANLVVISSAINKENQEVIAARKNNIEIIPRAEMLSRLMNQKYRIAVSGTHGKTTTTSMISLLLEGMNLDPTIAIGGEVNDIGGNAKLGRGDYVVVEADESDGSFLLLNPNIAIITNIENDHLDYFTNLEKTMESFQQFIEKIPETGSLLYGYDCPNTRMVAERVAGKKNVISYGFHQNAKVRAANTCLSKKTSLSEIYFGQHKLGNLKLNIPGYYNVSNALAAIATCLQLGLKFQDMAEILYHFNGVKRRQEIIFRLNDEFMIMDDYGHHPSEIKATLQAIRLGWPECRIITIFQPHRYSRTKLLLDYFGTAFQDSHIVIVNEIYAANEKPIPNISAELIYQKIKKEQGENIYYLPGREDTVSFLRGIIAPGDIVITMGAGDVWKVGTELAKKIKGFNKNRGIDC
ncbi:MAG TPA: UDP-N-acetylmuramate--L-alanine ligase [Atribacterota bacterium]|nr:UDP-N-acetylmuramate--L-alanine ligase [Atribacterota bacterium]